MTEKYRKKPVEVEVIKFDRDKWIKEESQENETYPMVVASIGSGFKTIPVIETLEGDMKVSDGDYIIKGVHGEFYPCKPDIFHETYEPVTDHQPELTIENNNDNPTLWSQIMTDHQPPFEVGEYYVNKLADIIKIRSIESGIVYYDYLKKGGNKILVTQGVDSQLNFSPATAEQIAEFKLAEYFDKNNISESQKDQYRKMLSNGKMPMGAWQALQTD